MGEDTPVPVEIEGHSIVYEDLGGGRHQAAVMDWKGTGQNYRAWAHGSRALAARELIHGLNQLRENT